MEKFQNFIKFPDEIRYISIDFTFGLNIQWVLNKCLKQYHNKNQFLLIVLLRQNDECNPEDLNFLIQNDDCITLRQYIKVVNFKEYLKFLRIQKSNLTKFNLVKEKLKIDLFKEKLYFSFRKSINLAKESISSDKKIKQLNFISQKYANLLHKYKS